MELTSNINPHIFREYDIRGKYPSEINEDIAYTVGRAFGTHLIRNHQKRCIVGKDNRLSGPVLHDALVQGILESGVDIIDLGTVTTPMYYFACIDQKIAPGIMITASHNPKDENGFKIAFQAGGNAYGETIQQFYQEVMTQQFTNGRGTLSRLDIKERYFEFLLSSIHMGSNPLKVVVDCGNGTTSYFAKDLFSRLPITLEMICSESDPTFPIHHPDPSVEENLQLLKETVIKTNADIGIAFDGDGDRVGVVTHEGNYLSMDQYMILMVRSILPTSNNKRVLYDVKCSKSLVEEIEKLKGTALCSRTGNSYTRKNTALWDCIFGGEYSGHVYFRDRFLGFDSGMYAGLRILELLSRESKSIPELLEGVNHYYATAEIKIPSMDDKKFQVIAKVKEYASQKNYPINDIDGVRIDLEDGWALVRCSNTGPNITARFEGKTEQIRDQLKEEFLTIIEQYN